MTREAARDALASHADEFAVVGELHDVPPYRVYEVRVDGRRAVLKIDAHPRGHAADEGRAQAYAAGRTSLPVPPVLGVGGDHFLAAWDDDAPHEPEAVDAAWARAAGACLGRLHAETAGAFDRYGRPVEDGGSLGLADGGRGTWVGAARDRIAYHRPYLAEFGYGGVADAADALLADHPEVFDGAGPPVLCHGNVGPEHAATADGGVVSLIDFEHALVAPGEYDYWRVAIPQFRGVDDEDPVPAAFRAGYRAERALPEGFERRRDAYLLVTLVSYAESLFLQRNVDADERGERADRLRELVDDTVERLRGDGGNGDGDG